MLKKGLPNARLPVCPEILHGIRKHLGPYDEERGDADGAGGASVPCWTKNRLCAPRSSKVSENANADRADHGFENGYKLKELTLREACIGWIDQLDEVPEQVQLR